MWVTSSWLRDHLLEAGVAAAVAAGLAVMALWPHLATVPFHLIWIALAVLFGLRTWGRSLADGVVLGLGAVTAGILVWHAAEHVIEPEEVAEAPLTTVAFLVMVAFLRRRQVRLEQTLAELRAEHAARERDRATARRTGHDLRNRLSVARGHAELIRMRATDPGVRADSDVVIEAVDTVVQISGRLRALERDPEPSS